jgi:flagellar basal body rod protein FlgG
MITAYQSALSGLKAFGTKIQANSNNIANAQTNGFKRN